MKTERKAKAPANPVIIYKKQNVWDAALERLRWLFDEFDNIIVNVSGGKDSTVLYELALIVAREKGRLPLKVLWLDQEAEWQGTVDTVERIMTNPDVDPLWYQIPFNLFNATSATDKWLDCWHPDSEAKWMRPHHPLARTENVFGTERFVDLFDAFLNYEFDGQPACHIAGVRASESPSRAVGLTTTATWKWATWGRRSKYANQVTMYPLYDWGDSDIWKAIHDNGWHYNPVYDAMYAHGLSPRLMRVSNVHHETAVQSLFYLQEIEPDTYAKLTQRIGGIDTAGKFGEKDFYVRNLPPMFSSWAEYRDYLLDKLVEDEKLQARYARKFAKHMDLYFDVMGDKVPQFHVNCLLTNDHEFVRLSSFDSGPKQLDIRRTKKREAEAA